MKQKQADARGYLLGEGKKFVVLKGSKTALIEKTTNSFNGLRAAIYLEKIKGTKRPEEVK